MNFSTGHQVVDAVGQLHFSGNITHHSWWQHIRYSNKRGDFTDPWAVNILADIVYWYRPVEIRDEQTGHLLGYRKKFSEDKLQRSPEAFSELFCCSVKVVREALKLLEQLNLIDIELRAVRTDWGVIPTAMFIGLNSDKLKQITHSTSKPQSIEKSLLPKSVRRNADLGKEGYPNGEGALPKSARRDDEMGNSSIYIDFTKTTQQITQESNSPCSPPGDNTCNEQPMVNGLQEENEVEAKKEVNSTPCVTTQNETTLLVKSSDSKKSQSSEAVATRKKNNKVCDKQLQVFFDAYIAEKPSNFTNHRELSEKHVKAIQKLVAQYKERSLNIFVGALTWCREQDSNWWRDKPLSLDELFSNGKVISYADKHFHALETDSAYCDRVEGRAVSKDPGRSNGFQIFDEQGKEVTGASARAAAAVANDPLLGLFLEQI